VQAVVSVYGIAKTVWQPTTDTLELAVYADTGPRPPAASTSGPAGHRFTGAAPSTPQGWEPSVGALKDATTGQAASLPVKSFVTVERSITGPTSVVWVSFDGATWMRMPTAGALAPRLVVPSGVTMSEGKWQHDGADVTPEELLRLVHWWGEGRGEVGHGTYGLNLTWRSGAIRNAAGEITGYHPIDARPDYMIDADEIERMRPENRRTAPPTDAQLAARDLAAPSARQAAATREELDPTIARMEADLRRRLLDGDLMPVALRAFRAEVPPEYVDAPERTLRADIRYRAKPRATFDMPRKTLRDILNRPRTTLTPMLQPTLVDTLPAIKAGTASSRLPAPTPRKPDAQVRPATPPPTLRPVVQVGQGSGDIEYRPAPTPKPKPKPDERLIRGPVTVE